jgi:predicted permease
MTPNPVNNSVISSLLPVVLLIGIGWFAGRRGWIGQGSVKDLSNLVFLLLTPALLFRTMSTVHLEQLDFRPVAVYFVSAWLLFAGTLALQGLNRRAAVLALAGTFSNTTMIGIPLVGLAFGPQGLVTLFALISLHALIMLTVATVVLEFAVGREQAVPGDLHHLALTVGLAVRSAVIHPVPLPIIAGLLFAQTGLVIPTVLDRPLELLGNAFGPLALVLVGVMLASIPVGSHWRGALALAAMKNLGHPVLLALIGWALGLHGLPFSVMILASSLPIGANVFLFSQRYQVAEELVTSSVAVSTALALLTVSAVLLLLGV